MVIGFKGVFTMKISTKGRYALRFMIDLAINNGSFVALKDIAARQNISKKYLEQIVPLLNKSGMLITNRGYQGGYKLAKRPDEYTIGDILRITEGSLAPVACLDGEVNTCERQNTCPTLELWQGLNKVINEYLDSVTISDLVDSYYQRGADEYYI